MAYLTTTINSTWHSMLITIADGLSWLIYRIMSSASVYMEGVSRLNFEEEARSKQKQFTNMIGNWIIEAE